MVGRKLYYNLFGPLIVKRGLDLEAIARVVAQGESGHTGEIAVSVAANAPILSPLTPRERALDAFANLHVWDTDQNTGVLLFISLPEKAIEIIADRGAAQQVDAERWTKICADAGTMMARGETLQAVLEYGILAIGEELRKVFPGKRKKNQLPNEISVE